MKRNGEGAFTDLTEVVKKKLKNIIDLGFEYFKIMFPYGNDLKVSKDFANLVMNKF